jgi:transcriptional regulator with GAF, ATPase, and Fis domain
MAAAVTDGALAASEFLRDRRALCSNPDTLLKLTQILDRPASLDRHWSQLASGIASLLDAEAGCILLSDHDDGGVIRTYGNSDSPSFDSADDVLADRKGLADILATARSLLSTRAPLPNAPVATRLNGAQTSVILAPISIEGATVGVVHVRGERDRLQFAEDHFVTIHLVAILIGKSLHLARLERLLNSRFAQLALMRGTAASREAALRDAVKQRRGVSRLVAKSLYREMIKAGFEPNDIISSASEIISQLSADLRMRRSNTPVTTSE